MATTYTLGYKLVDEGTDPNIPFILGYSLGSIAITTLSLNPVCPRINYSVQLGQSGGVEPVVWTITAGTLPEGLTLTTSGLISGFITGISYNYEFTIQVEDANLSTDSKDLSLLVKEGAVLEVDTTPQNFIYGVGVNYPLTTREDPSTVDWTLISGTLPPGIILSSPPSVLVGTLWGVPGFPDDGSGNSDYSNTGYSFVLRGTNKITGCYSEYNFSVYVWTPPVIITPYLKSGELNVYYSEVVVAEKGRPFTVSGTSFYKWSIISGSLPPGLGLNSTTGGIAGIPKKIGLYSFTVKVLDSNNLTDTKNYTIVIPDPAIADTGYLNVRLPSVKSRSAIVQDNFHQKHLIEYVPSNITKK